MFLNSDKDSKLFISLGLVLFFLIVREAILIPLTHDEYSTIMVSYQSLFDIVTYKDPIPNNHILNTLLLKLNIITFGDHLFSNRLHNVLSFLIYYYFAVLIAKKLSSNNVLQLLFVSMIVFQPYLLDFFCVTRGYCLSVSLQLVSLYYALIYYNENTSKSLYYSMFFGAMSVLANFTLLNYYLPLCGVLVIYSFISNRKINFKKLRNEIGAIFMISLILGMICYLPFSKMVSTNQFVFWSSNNFYSDTIVPLFQSLRSGISYLNIDPKNFAVGFLIFVFTFQILIFALEGTKIFKNSSYLFSTLLLLSVITYNNLQFYIANIPFLNARTSLFFIPIVGLYIFSLFNILYKNHQFIGKVLSISLIFLCAQHFIRGYNGRANHEWYFNQSTYKVLDEIIFLVESNNLQKPVKVDCHWFYHPSLTYHIDQKYRGILELLPYHKDVNPESTATFYYSEPNEVDILSPKFDKIKEFSGNYSFLLKHK